MSDVLLVDDDEEVRDLLRMALEEDGYTVAEAANGQVGLERLRASSGRFVVIVDYLMPEMDGLTLLRVVAQDETLAARHHYIIMSAGRFFPAENETLRGLSVRVLPKPFDLDHFLHVVREVASALESGA